MIVPPGSTIGIIGGGQLGRMLALAAAPLGYKVHVFAPEDSPCAAVVTAQYSRAQFDDADALARFAADVDVITYEFENLPVAPLAALGDKLRPGTRSLAIAQDRVAEKGFIEAHARLSPWRAIDCVADVVTAHAELGGSIVLKSRRFGYDGKGQAWVREADAAEQAWESIGRKPAVAEAGVDYIGEFSVLVARGADGLMRAWAPPANRHEDGILRHSQVPTDLPGTDEGVRIARTLAEALGHIGVLAVEFFATADGPLVNEIAPRVHNSGHWTIEGSETSQFEQHIRAICGLPLGATGLTGRAASMENLIGDDADRWPGLIDESGAHLHLYDKGEARPGRKMGHVTRVTR